MRFGHGWHVSVVMMALAAAAPVHAAPQHIVSTNLCTDEYVFRLVPRERIAALSVLAGDTHPTVSTIARQVKGIALVRPNAEAVLAKHPDLVVMFKGTGPRLRAHLADAGIKILEVPWANSLAAIRRVTLMLGRELGAEARANRLLEKMDAQLAAARAHAPRPPVSALIYEPNGYVTADRVSEAIMQAAGLRNAVREMGMTRLGRVPVEDVVASAPELLILNTTHEGGPALADAALRHPALAALKGRSLVAQVSLTPLLCAGPWSADVAGEFAKLGRKAAALAKARGRH